MIWSFSRRESMPSWRRSSVWRSSASRTAAWKRLVHRSRRCCISWLMAAIKGRESTLPEYVRCFYAKRCSPATGTRSACASSRNGYGAEAASRRGARNVPSRAGERRGLLHQSAETFRSRAPRTGGRERSIVLERTPRHHRRRSFPLPDRPRGDRRGVSHMTQPATARDDNYVLTLEEIGALASEGGKPAETLTNIVALVARRFQTDVCSAYLLEPDRANLVLAATLGLRPQCIGTLRMALHEGLAGLVAEQVRPIFHPSSSMDT